MEMHDFARFTFTVELEIIKEPRNISTGKRRIITRKLY